MNRSSSSIRLTDENKQIINARFGSVSKGVAITANVATAMGGLSSFFPEPTDALMWTVGMFPAIVHSAWEESLHGIFSKGELCMIADVLNDAPALKAEKRCVAGSYLMPVVAGAFSLCPGAYEKKWGVVKAPLIKKLEALTLFDRVAIEMWVGYFWNAEDLGKPGHVERCVALLGA